MGMKMNKTVTRAKKPAIGTGSRATKSMDILDHIEKIVEVSRKMGIDKCLSSGKSHFEYVTGKLGITPIQAILFSHFMERNVEDQIVISKIAGDLKCSTEPYAGLQQIY
jgi:hypothetical protein